MFKFTKNIKFIIQISMFRHLKVYSISRSTRQPK